MAGLAGRRALFVLQRKKYEALRVQVSYFILVLFPSPEAGFLQVYKPSAVRD